MDMLTGFRTIMVAVIGGILVPVLAKWGFVLTEDQQAWLISGSMSLLMIIMRFMTTTPVGSKVPDAPPPAPPGTPNTKQSGTLRVGILPLLLALSACASLGLQSANTFDEKLAYAYGVHTAVLQTATLGVTDHSLNTDDGKKVLDLADQSRSLLDAAKTIETAGGDMSAAQSKLILATSILSELQKYLNNRK